LNNLLQLIFFGGSTMTRFKLFTALAVLLSLGIGISCAEPKPPVPTGPSEADLERERLEREARERAEREAREARERAEREAREAAERQMRQAAEAALMDINFDYNKAEIRRQDREKFNAIAEFMRNFPQARVRIEGHCDERGTIEYNMALGERRAFAAKNYLVNLGIADSRFTTQSFGKELPKVFGSNERSWFANRRCEFKIQ
jgi:peptidoglycan-associated lipoprotein